MYSFQTKTKAYQADNPYMSVSHITREALDEAETEEMQTEEVQTEEAGAIEMPLPGGGSLSSDKKSACLIPQTGAFAFFTVFLTGSVLIHQIWQDLKS